MYFKKPFALLPPASMHHTVLKISRSRDAHQAHAIIYLLMAGKYFRVSETSSHDVLFEGFYLAATYKYAS